MPKNILIYSDGTGQIGGLRPDQRLSNIYKIYRATRPGPDSPIKPDKQVAFYDPGLGVGEVDGITFRRIRNALQASVGTGIDENVIDCYEAIIANYDPGDRVCIFGFSRGCHKSVANPGTPHLKGVTVCNGLKFAHCMWARAILGRYPVPDTHEARPWEVPKRIYFTGLKALGLSSLQAQIQSHITRRT